MARISYRPVASVLVSIALPGPRSRTVAPGMGCPWGSATRPDNSAASETDTTKTHSAMAFKTLIRIPDCISEYGRCAASDLTRGSHARNGDAAAESVSFPAAQQVGSETEPEVAPQPSAVRQRCHRTPGPIVLCLHLAFS